MTVHTRAATDDILEIFSQPLRNLGPIGAHTDSAGESDYDEDDYASAGESTGTGRVSGTSEVGDDETGTRNVAVEDLEVHENASEWSDFSSAKHIPVINRQELETNSKDGYGEGTTECDRTELLPSKSPKPVEEIAPIRFVPLPPEGYEAPTGPYRDPCQLPQNRLPFMTPIVEKTESSVGLLTQYIEKDYFSSKTSSRIEDDKDLLSHDGQDRKINSPFQEIVNEAAVERVRKAVSRKPVTRGGNNPIIKDTQCNPVDESIRNTILEDPERPISSVTTFFDHRPQTYNKNLEIRKFVKALAKVSKNTLDRTTTNLSTPPTLSFPNTPSSYTIRRELGKGAFAPVYLAEEPSPNNDDRAPILHAIKTEHPPTPWEFHIMNLAHTRLGHTRTTDSLATPKAFHLFADEGYLVEEYRDQGTLLDLANLARDSPTTPGVLDEAVVMFFAVELLRTVEDLHRVGLLHGDLKADNCLVRLSECGDPDWSSVYDARGGGGWSSKGLLLIDFGRGVDMRAFRPDVQFIADWKTGKQDCPEMRDLRPWTYQIDYWGVAGVVHVLLFGRYIEDVVEKGDGEAGVGGKRYRLREGLKRYWATDVWGGFFDVLMNPGCWVREDGGRLPCRKRLKEVREGMEGWLVENGEKRGLKTSLKKLEERIRERKK